jgi:hypothetical protein
MLVCALMLGLSAKALPVLAAADDIKPIVTVSFAGYDEFMADIDAIGKLGGNATLLKMVEGHLAIFTQGKGLDFLDKKAPWGSVITLSDAGLPTGFVFLPISDLKQAMEIAMNSPLGGVIKEDNGVYEINSPNGETLFAAQHGKIAAIVKDKADLEGIPDEPEKLLGDLPKKYLLAVRASVNNVPEALKAQGVQMMTMVSQAGMMRTEDETDEQFAARQAMTQRSIDQTTMLINETNEIVVGLNIDRQTNQVCLDFQIDAVDGSKLAAEFAELKPGKTNLAGFDLPGAAITANSVGTMTQKNADDAKEAIKSLRDMLLAEVDKQELTESQLKLAKELIDSAVEIADKNIEMKKSDAGLAVRLEPSAFTLVAGSMVADGKPIEELVKKLFDAAKEEEPAVGEMMKMNADSYKGVRFHMMTIPIPEDAQELQPLVGDNLEVVIGISDTQAFVAAGRDAAKTLKEVIDKSQAEAGKEIPPMKATLSILKLVQFAAAVAPDDEVKASAGMAAMMLAQTEGKDHLVITGEGIPNGMKIRCELEEGFLKMLGNATQTFGMPGAMPPGAVPPGAVPPAMPSTN